MDRFCCKKGYCGKVFFVKIRVGKIFFFSVIVFHWALWKYVQLCKVFLSLQTNVYYTELHVVFHTTRWHIY